MNTMSARSLIMAREPKWGAKVGSARSWIAPEAEVRGRLPDSSVRLQFAKAAGPA
jgi:hypothetical protein